MRGRGLRMLFCVGLCASACASVPMVRLDGPVGPDPRVSARPERFGTLVVDTDLSAGRPDGVDALPLMRMPYVILDARRRQVAEVTHDGLVDGEPRRVRLAPGTYIVRAPGLKKNDWVLGRSAQVEAVVRVDAGRTTVLHLDEPWQPPAGLGGEVPSARALPGWPVGWSARSGARLGVESGLRYVGSPSVAAAVAEFQVASPGTTFVAGGDGDGGVEEIALGTASLAGVIGKVHPPEGVACAIIGYDRLAFLVRQDSPVKFLSGEQALGLLSGSITSWSALGGPDVPVVLLAGRGTGATRLTRSARAVALDLEAIGPRVAGSSSTIALTSLATWRGEEGLQAVDAADEALTVPLSLCAAKDDSHALTVLHWARSEEGQQAVRRHFAGLVQLERRASR